MVSRTAWLQIVFLLVVGCALYALSAAPKQLTYSATSPALDIAVVDGIAKTDREYGTTTQARAAVVPHHLVASEAVALGVRAVSASSPKTIVLISPDHFGKCRKILCTTYGEFKTFFGTVRVSGPDVKTLLADTALVEESDLFTDEHGIYSIVPFIKHYAPNAQIVPIVISQRGEGADATRAELVALIGKLLAANDTGLFISSDFSHYLPLLEAENMDKMTQASFCAGSARELLKLKNPDQSDCPLCLWLLYEEAIKHGFWNPVLKWHSNSATLLHDTAVQETTSHFTFVLGETGAPGQCLK